MIILYFHFQFDSFLLEIAITTQQFCPSVYMSFETYLSNVSSTYDFSGKLHWWVSANYSIDFHESPSLSAPASPGMTTRDSHLSKQMRSWSICFVSENQFPPPLPIEILSTTYRGRLIWYWYVIRWVCTGTSAGFVTAILKCESGCIWKFFLVSMRRCVRRGNEQRRDPLRRTHFQHEIHGFCKKKKLIGREAQQWRGEEVMQAERKKRGFKREGRDRAGDGWMDGWMEVKEGERASVKNASLSSKASLGPLQRVCSHVCALVSFCPVGINTLQSHCVLRWTPPWRPVPSKHTSPSFSFSFTVLLTSLSPSI